jgi:soluble lytic murein transglycosylase-like protein
VSANLIKAIIVQESSCGNQVVGPMTKNGQACGPIQILPSTANNFKGPCGITENVTCGWLSNKQNWDQAVCLGAQYLKSLAGPCGNDVRNIAAGYNAGPGRCAAAANCGSDTSCDPTHTQVRQWECLYDDNAHTTCNAGLNETRNYATRVLYCTNNPGY